MGYLSIILAALASMVLGMIWYSPQVFGTYWMKASKISTKKVDAKSMRWRYALAFVGSVVTAFILADFFFYLKPGSLLAAIELSSALWLGFIAPISLGMVLWENKPWGVYFLTIGYYLVSFILMSTILFIGG